MSSPFASGKWAISECDRCGFRYKLKELRSLVIKTKNVNILVCPSCWEEDQPQLQLGMYPVNDPQALRNPRPDNSYYQSGLNGLQLTNDEVSFGTPSEGSRQIQWGWAPVGLNNPLGLSGLVSTLLMQGAIGTVTVVTEEN
ncbi:hypothetical protein UFOVP1288_57 [uncultured Caudovirales phage]|uniref:Uncharacterized protein n=1 Tax=uncultured Caudovirales phage TaxID=2100421 RepID=A0A6J5RGC6_9CAUD|nr:hypothetical protein UFOVP1195_57 [uncultured Caudovirales phage]CAB4196059.1 hypothetical protein UFOVP1288_57 [uncultured Caudovirales phage]CAB4205127.1 hypothetical protein UFOVP1409_57 [uncultured Caudovirales phage]